MAYGEIGYTPGAGALVAIDAIAGRSYQLVKSGYGAEGAWTPLEEKPATESLQTSGNTKLDTIVTALADLLAELNAKTQPNDTQPISAAGLPLPTGASTEATLAAMSAKLPAALVGGKLSVTDPAALPLPTGAATEATLATIATAVVARNSPATGSSPGVFILAVRQDADTQAAADGDFASIKLDEEGRLKVSSKPASYADITGDITAIQATIGTPVAGGTVAGDVSRASNIMALCSGTFSTVNCSFEGSLESAGDTNWFSIQAVRTNANTIETTTGNLSAQPTYAWEMSVNALKRVRVRCTARTSGTQSWRFVQGTYATEPIPAAQISGTQPVSGTVTASGCVGPAAHDAAISGNPIRIAARALTADYTAVATGDLADLKTTLTGALVVRQDAIPEACWSYAAATGGIVNTTTAVTIKAAAAAGIRNYLKTLFVPHDLLGGATEWAVRDGAAGAVLARGKLQTPADEGVVIPFDPPLRGTAATLMEFVTLSAVTGGVFPNATGYTAP